MSSFKLFVLDTETTGLFPNDGHRVIEFYGETGVLSKQGFKTTGSLHFKQKIDRSWFAPGQVEKAFEINGYTDEKWKDAPLAGSEQALEQWRKVNDLAKGHMIIGQNVINFDDPFIVKELALAGIDKPGWDRRQLDIMVLSMFVALMADQRSFSLDPVYKALGGPAVEAHHAYEDVQMVKYVLAWAGKRLLGETSLDIFSSEALRDELDRRRIEPDMYNDRVNEKIVTYAPQTGTLVSKHPNGAVIGIGAPQDRVHDVKNEPKTEYVPKTCHVPGGDFR